jgi:hypothetical protein
MFTGPNGFWKFALFDDAGSRVPRIAGPAAPAAVRSILGEVGAGARCTQCHQNGPVGSRDELRGLIAAASQATPEVRNAVQALHPEQASIDALVREDHERTARSVAAAGIERGVRIRGLEPIRALGQIWHDGGGMARVIAETGWSEPDLRRRLDALSGADRLIARRIESGPLTRIELDRLLLALQAQAQGTAAGSVGTSGVAAAATAETSSSDGAGARALPPALTVWPSASVYRSGETAVFHAVTSTACHLTLVNVDRRGVATVLFPNDFEPDNLLQPDRERTVPGPTAPYQFRLREPGREQIIALCTEGARTFAGIEHDYERQRFTVLGNWRAFVESELARLEGGIKPTPEPPLPRGRRTTPVKEKDAEPKLPGFADPHLRAVTGYEVR